MLFSWLRWSFSLILELNLPPQSNEHPSRERQNTHGGLERSQRSSHTAHGLALLASAPLAVCAFVICMFVDVCHTSHVQHAVISVYIPEHVSFLYTGYVCFCTVCAKCRWMWLRQIFTELKSYSAFYVCMHGSWSEQIWVFDFILGSPC